MKNMSSTRSDLSWGLYPIPQNQKAIHFSGTLPKSIGLPRGQGRSYGDSCLVSDGTLIKSEWLDHFSAFDEMTGVLTCEAGVTIDQTLKTFVPKGFFPYVVPGTKFISIGGAIANDIHGKNHHAHGTFAHHVLSFELKRSTGETIHCSREENANWFYATIGGLGLTGFITQARIKLMRIPSAYIEQDEIPFTGLNEFQRLSEESAAWPFTVAWIDSRSGADRLRGIFMRGRFSEDRRELKVHENPRLRVPFFFPEFILNPLSIRIFNALYYHRLLGRRRRRITHYDSYFFPLDQILLWNRIYGRRGLLQYQLQVPDSPAGEQCIRQVLDLLKASGAGSFLSVLKVFGARPSEGLLSFPRPGLTLALDFPMDPKLLPVLSRADQWVNECGGRLYPAKDSRMSGATFRNGYNTVEQFKTFLDPQLTSDFWRRVQ
jgi:FAD/FMN-containing dehydrogenase